MVSYFDEAYYLRVYSDVRQAVGQGVFASGFEHYQRYGGAEGRNASASFFGGYYLATNPDVKAAFAQGAFATPLVHFEQYGLAENRVSTSAAGGFDAARYLADFPDVAASVGAGGVVSALDHYLRYGAAEGRPYHVRPDYAAGLSLFDEAYYLARNADVAAAVNAGRFTSGLQHFQLAGAAERRAPSADFDARHYEAVLKTVSPGSLLEISSGQYRSSFDHFQQVGLKQNWAPVARVDGFDPARYLADNPDVAAAVSGGGFVSALDHYLRYGAEESRPAYTAGGDTIAGPDATFTLTADMSQVNEGGTVTFTLQTTNVEAGSRFTYTILTGPPSNSNFAPDPVTAADIAGGAMSGTVTIGADGRATFPITLAADATSEKAYEALRVTIAGQISGALVNDSSRAPEVTTNFSSVAEGSTVAFAVNGQAGLQYTYVISGISAEDLQGGALTGTVTLGSDGKATVPLILLNDGVTEANETLTFSVGASSRAITLVDAAGTTPVYYSTTAGTDIFVGAQGNDNFNATDTTLGAADRLTGGGGTDWLSISYRGTDQIFAPSDTMWTGVSGIESVWLSAAGGAADSIAFFSGSVFDSVFRTDGISLRGGTNVGAVTLDLSGGGGGTVFTGAAAITAGSGAGSQIVAGGSGATTVNATSTSGSQTITGGNLTNVTATSTQGDQIIASSGAGAVTITATSSAGTQTLTTGGGNDTVTSSAGVGRSATISTGGGNDTIVAGFSTDLITGGLGADTMTGGGGTDTFAFGANGSVIGTSMDAILDFNTGGGDLLTFAGTTVVPAADSSAAVAGSNVQTSAGGLIAFHASDNTLALKTAAVQADAELDAAGSVAMFVEGGSTYVYYAGAASGNLDDQLVQLTGIATLTTITGGATTTIA